MSRRARLLRRTVIGCGLLTGIVIAVVAWPRAKAIYDPAAEAEGITRELDRGRPAGPVPIRFREVAETAGLGFVHFAGTRSSQLPEDMGSGAAWGDYDGDGDEDLFLVNIAGPLGLSGHDIASSQASCRLFRNDGKGRFEDVSRSAGLDRRLQGMGAAWADHDGDGHLDLMVTAHGSLHLFRNRADGTFEDVSRSAGLDSFRGFWTGVSWADPDRDGWMDAYVCGYVRYDPGAGNSGKSSRQFEAEVPFTLNPSSYPPERNLLLHNRGDGTFVDIAESAGVANERGRSLSAAWADFNADGWLDLYVANDVSESAMYLNRGDGTFQDASHPSCTADYRGAMGIGVADWDRDGDQDVFVTHWIAQQNALFSNQKIFGNGKVPPLPLFSDIADRVGLGQSSLDRIGWGTVFLDLDSDGWLDLFAANGSTFQRPEDPTRLVPMLASVYWNRGPRLGFFEIALETSVTLRTPVVGRGVAAADHDRDGDVDLIQVNHSGPVWLLSNESPARGHWLQVRARAARDPLGIGCLVRVRSASGVQVRQVGCQPSYLSQSSTVEHFGLGSDAVVDSLEVSFPGGRRIERTGVPVDRVVVVDECEERDTIREFWKRYEAASTARREGRDEEAVRLYTAALELRPRHEDSLYNLGGCFANLGRSDEARRTYDKLVKINPMGSSRGYMQLGRLLARPPPGGRSDLGAARRIYQRALEIDPESGATLSLAEVTVLEGRGEDAEKRLAEMSVMNVTHPAIPFLQGFLRWRTGDAAGALERFRETHRRFVESGRRKDRSEEGDVLGGLRKRWAPVARQSLSGDGWSGLPLDLPEGPALEALVQERYRNFQQGFPDDHRGGAP